MIEKLTQFDGELLLFFNSIHSTYFDNFMWTATGRFIWIPFYVAILLLLLQKAGVRRTAVIVVGVALAITFADQLCASVLRPIFARYRPANQLNPLSEFVHIVNGYRGGRYGFPSCHAANTFAVLAFLCPFLKSRQFTGSMLVWALLNCYSRMYLGVHYPGDIIFGAILGLLIGFGLYVAVNSLMNRYDLHSNRVPAFRSITDSPSIAIYGLLADILLIVAIATVMT